MNNYKPWEHCADCRKFYKQMYELLYGDNALGLQRSEGAESAESTALRELGLPKKAEQEDIDNA